MTEPDKVDNKKRLLWDAIAIFGLYSLSVARPLFELFAPNAEFFVYKRASRLEIFIFIVCLSLLIPSFLLLVRFLLSKISTKAGNVFQGLVISTLTLFFILPGLNRQHLIPDYGLVLLMVCCAIIGVGYFLFNWIRLFYVYLAPAILIVPLLFLFSPRINRILFSTVPEIPSVKIQSDTPLVFIIFDEFPLISLLDENREIDSRYPNFLRMSKEWNWYRGTSTVAELTESAIPGILTGSYPQKGRLPVLMDYPKNLFTLLKNSHRLVTFETVSWLNPGHILANEGEGYRSRWRSLVSDLWIVYLHVIVPEKYLFNVPPVAQSWGDFAANAAKGTANRRSYAKDRVMLLKDFLDVVQPSNTPAVYFLHVILPHVPWHLLPSGKDYKSRTFEGMIVKGDRWRNDEPAVQRAYQRHLLQVGYMDQWLGKLIRRLEETGLYDKSVIVVVADHGISFTTGGPPRMLSRENAEEIMFVPLFIKAPHQKIGKTIDWNVETIDILPTIADFMNFKIPWEADGVSVARQSPPPDRPRMICDPFCQNRYKFDSKLFADGSALKRKITWFGNLAQDRTFQFGPCSELIGKTVPQSAKTAENLTVRLRNKDLFASINPDLETIPTFVAGILYSSSTLPARIAMGISMNGVFVSTTYSLIQSSNTHVFDSVVPESALRPGNNHLQIYEIPSCSGAPLLLQESAIKD
jgi:Sulfatase